MCVRAADKQAPIQGQKARGRRERKRESARERRERRRDSARERERAREQEQQPDELEEVEQNKEHFVRFNTFINKECHLVILGQRLCASASSNLLTDPHWLLSATIYIPHPLGIPLYSDDSTLRLKTAVTKARELQI